MPVRVLIVEDERAVSENLAAFLEDEGMEVVSAESGEAALEQLKAGLVADVCIMDMRLPGIDGFEAIRAISQVSPNTRFVVHTGSTSPTLRRDVEALGVPRDFVFFKPVLDMRELAVSIRQLLADRENELNE